MALGIETLGRHAAELLASKWDMEGLRNATVAEFAAIHSLGETTAELIATGLAERGSLIDRLLQSVRLINPSERAGGPLSDETVVFTGKLEQLNRRNAQQLVTKLGGTAGSSVTQDTTLLVVGGDGLSAAKPSSKIRARKLIEDGQPLRLIEADFLPWRLAQRRAHEMVLRWPIRPCVVLLALSLTLSAGTAGAASGEHEPRLGVGVAPPIGVVHGRYRYCLTDFWALGGSLEQGVDAKGAHTAATVDARLTIDALTFVPSVVAGVGARARWSGEVEPVALGALALGWRPERSWALQVRVQVEAIGLNGEVRAGLAVAWGRLWSPASDLDFASAQSL